MSGVAERPGFGEGRRLSPPWDLGRVVRVVALLAIGIVGIYLFRYLQFAPGELVDGLFRKDGYLSRALPPTFTSSNSLGGDVRSEWPMTAHQLGRTLVMACAGTGLAALFSFPVGLAAARNTSPNRYVVVAARTLISFCRATPEIVFATVFVLIASIGEKAGVMALAVHSIGMLGKLLADRIEEIDPRPLEAAQASGASRLQAIYNAVLPQVAPSWLNNVLYRFDINLRASAVLGFVGAGGIGVLLQSDLKNATRYPLGMATALSLAGVIVVVDVVSNALRRRLMAADERLALSARESVSPAGLVSSALRPPWTLGRAVFLGAVWAGVGLAGFAVLDVGLLGLKTLRPFGVAVPVPQFLAIPLQALSRLPDYWPRWDTVGYLVRGEVLNGSSAWTHAWTDTLAIAGGAAFMAVVAAIPAAFLMARSTSPIAVVSRGMRFLLVAFRSLPEVALVFFFVSALGIQSPFPAAAAMAVGAFAFITKITADDLDGLGAGAQEALRSTGATHAQAVVGGVVPAAVPMIVANALYALDVCIRGGVLLGTVAGVGIGYLFTQTAFLPNPFQTVGAFVVSTFVIVFGIEQLGALIRRRVL